MESRKKKVLGTALGLLAAAALIVGTWLPSPGGEEEAVLPQGPPPVVMELEETQALEEEGDRTASQEARESRKLSHRFALWVQGLPQAVRLLVILPLWGLGTALSAALSALWAGLLSPALGTAASWALGTGVLAGAFGLGAKLLFPKLPWKAIFNKGNLLLFAGTSLVLTLADDLLPALWPAYAQIALALKAFLSLSLITFLILRLRQRKAATSP